MASTERSRISESCWHLCCQRLTDFLVCFSEERSPTVIFFYVKFSHGACLYVLVLQNAIEIASIVSCQRYVHCVLAFQNKWPLPNYKQNQAKNVWDFKIRQVLNLVLLSFLFCVANCHGSENLLKVLQIPNHQFALQASLSYMYILYVGNFYISNNYDLKFKVLSSIFLVSINLVKILMRQYCGQWKSSKGILINF